ncbi:uncharacterized protein LOC135499926 [Lineus longissimus]|uniref:uncharacterized protein LOC135499926 n=1 Tax=Lineus longissimus TaxID=88925 RepID=UPI00315C82AC
MRELRNRTLRCSNCADGSSESMYAGDCGHVTCPKCAGIEQSTNGDVADADGEDYSLLNGGVRNGVGANECPTCQKFLLFPGELHKLPVTFSSFSLVEKMQLQNSTMPVSDEDLGLNSNSSTSTSSYGGDERDFQNRSTQPFVADETTMKCREHPLSQMRIYCKTCRFVFCTKKSCAARHVDHVTADLHHVLRDAEDYIQKRMRKVGKVREKVLEREHVFKQRVERKNTAFENMEYQVRNIAKLYHEAIDRAERSMLCEIRHERVSFDRAAEKMTNVLKDADTTLTALLKIKDIFIGNRSRVRADNVLHMKTFLRANEDIFENVEAPGAPKELDLSFHKGISFLENTAFLQKKSSLLGKLVVSANRQVYCVGEIKCKTAADSRVPNLTGLAILPAGEVVVVDCANEKVKLFTSIGPANVTTKQYSLEWESRGINDRSPLDKPSDIAVLSSGNFIVTNEGLAKPLEFTREGEIDHYSKLNGIGGNNLIGWTSVAIDNDKAFWGCWDRMNSEGVVLMPDEELEKRERKFSLKCFVSTRDRCPSKMTVRVDPYSRRVTSMVISMDCWRTEPPNGITALGGSTSALNNLSYSCLAFVRRDGDMKYIQSYGDIVDVCYAQDGNVLAADRANDRILLLSDRGAFRKYLIEAEDGLEAPVGVALDNDGHIVVAQKDGVVKIFRLFETCML